MSMYTIGCEDDICGIPLGTTYLAVNVENPSNGFIARLCASLKTLPRVTFLDMGETTVSTDQMLVITRSILGTLIVNGFAPKCHGGFGETLDISNSFIRALGVNAFNITADPGTVSRSRDDHTTRGRDVRANLRRNVNEWVCNAPADEVDDVREMLRTKMQLHADDADCDKEIRRHNPYCPPMIYHTLFVAKHAVGNNCHVDLVEGVVMPYALMNLFF